MEHLILKVPEWRGSIVFDRETIMFLLVIAVFFAGISICFRGYQYFRVLCVAALGCLFGMAGIIIAQRVTSHHVVMMIFWVTFTFVCACISYYISGLVDSLFRKLHIREKLAAKQYLISALLGAAVVCVDVYAGIYRSPFVLLLFALLAAAGGFYGRKKAAQRRPFHTYDDLCAIEPLAEEGAAEEHA